jgi:hypothetical protein
MCKDVMAATSSVILLHYTRHYTNLCQQHKVRKPNNPTNSLYNQVEQDDSDTNNNNKYYRSAITDTPQSRRDITSTTTPANTHRK